MTQSPASPYNFQGQTWHYLVRSLGSHRPHMNARPMLAIDAACSGHAYEHTVDPPTLSLVGSTLSVCLVVTQMPVCGECACAQELRRLERSNGGRAALAHELRKLYRLDQRAARAVSARARRRRHRCIGPRGARAVSALTATAQPLPRLCGCCLSLRVFLCICGCHLSSPSV